MLTAEAFADVESSFPGVLGVAMSLVESLEFVDPG